MAKKLDKKNQVLNAEGMPILGWLVSWSTRDFKITRPDLVAALTKVGIDADIARTVIPKNAAIRAMREFGKGQGRFHRKVADQENKAAFIVAGTQVDANFNPDFKTETKGVFDKNAKKLEVTGNNKREVEEAFERNKATYSGDQFRSIALRYVKRYCDGVSYLETGNLYFVPVFRKAKFDRLVALFNLLAPNGVRLSFKEEVNTKSVRKVMWDLAINDVAYQIKNLQTDLSNLSGKDANEKSLELRLKKYKDLRVKADMYATALSGRADSLKKQIDELTAQVTKSMDKLSDEEGEVSNA